MFGSVLMFIQSHHTIMFFWGIFGGLAINIVEMANIVRDGRKLPKRYTTLSFWGRCLIISIIGGVLVVAYDVDKAILAIHIGVSVPLIIEQLIGGYPLINSGLE